MTFYSGLASTASQLLQSKGQQLTFSRETTLAFDPIKGKNATTTSTFTGYGAAFDYTAREIDGQRVQNGDIRLFLEATATAPIIGDTTTIDGGDYRVISVNSKSPAGTVVAYELQLRK